MNWCQISFLITYFDLIISFQIDRCWINWLIVFDSTMIITIFFLETLLMIVIIWTLHLIVFKIVLILSRNSYESNLKMFLFKIIINCLNFCSVILISFVKNFNDFRFISIQLTSGKLVFLAIWAHDFDDCDLLYGKPQFGSWNWLN